MEYKKQVKSYREITELLKQGYTLTVGDHLSGSYGFFRKKGEKDIDVSAGAVRRMGLKGLLKRKQRKMCSSNYSL